MLVGGGLTEEVVSTLVCCLSWRKSVIRIQKVAPQSPGCINGHLASSRPEDIKAARYDAD